ncbi:hypothetical protein Psch_02910 [Pelotomaculum schinkii]|uniref:Uncharacterized protein n=1 Tax=Pelotomaculum schinkii TaxID=78350 RepID=A0A4Y7RA76_9FIRM|nr:DUF6338 family protein [Pelotomaculum schinkii]TEB05868.1 hypothetical protein Psch_02910 [Pelotomaculum schinkii]
MAVINGLNNVLQIIVFLLPGFLTTLVRDALVVNRPKDSMERITESLSYSLILNILFNFVFSSSIFPVIYTDNTLQITSNMMLLYLVFLSILLGLFISLVINYDILYNLLRYLKITKKSSRISVWYDVFVSNPKKWLRVTLNDGTVLIGWADYYSDDPNNNEMFLADVSITEKEGDEREVKGPGVYVNGKQIKIIEFLD